MTTKSTAADDAALRDQIMAELVEAEILKRRAAEAAAVRAAQQAADAAADTARILAAVEANRLAARERSVNAEVERITHEVRRTLREDGLVLAPGDAIAQYQASCSAVVTGSGATCNAASDVQSIKDQADLELVQPFLMGYLCRIHRPDARPVGWRRDMAVADGRVIPYFEHKTYAMYAKSAQFLACDETGRLLDV